MKLNSRMWTAVWLFKHQVLLSLEYHHSFTQQDTMNITFCPQQDSTLGKNYFVETTTTWHIILLFVLAEKWRCRTWQCAQSHIALYIWWKPNTTHRQKHFMPSVKHGGGRLMVLAWQPQGLSDLQTLKTPTMNFAVCCGVPESNVRLCVMSIMLGLKANAVNFGDSCK